MTLSEVCQIDMSYLTRTIGLMATDWPARNSQKYTPLGTPAASHRYSVDTGRLVFMNQCRHFPSQKIKHANGHKSEIHNFCPTARQAKFEIRRRIKWIGIVL